MESREGLERTLRVSTVAAKVSWVFVLAVSAWNAFPVYRSVLLHSPQTEITHLGLRRVLFFVTAILWGFFEILRKRTKAVLKSPDDRSS